MKKRKLFYVRDTLSSDKKKMAHKKIEVSILLMKIVRQTSFIVALILLCISLLFLVILLIIYKVNNKNLIDFVTAVVIPLLSSFAVMINDIDKANKEYNGSFLIKDSEFEQEINEKIESSEKYKGEKNKYSWHNFNDNSDKKKKYETSDLVNQFLLDTNFPSSGKKIEFKFDKQSRKKFITPKESLRVLDHKIKEKIEKNEIIFNNNLVRLSSDLVDLNDKFTIKIQKTNYFSAISTNDCMCDSIRKRDDASYKFSGSHFSIDMNQKKNNSERITLYDLTDSYCANIIGMSSLAITSDNKIVILQQGNTNESKFQLVPSGSGSAEYVTIKHLKKYKGKVDFNEYITHEMVREMLEEIQVSKVDYKKICKLDEIKYEDKNKNEEFILRGKKEIKKKCDISEYNHQTYLIGYCRLLHRAGKPDFFGITKLDIDSHILRKYFEIYAERVEKNKKHKENNENKEKSEIKKAYFIDPLNFDNPVEDIKNKIKRYENKDNVISLQLKYIVDELVKLKLKINENSEDNERSDFSKLVNSFFKS